MTNPTARPRVVADPQRQQAQRQRRARPVRRARPPTRRRSERSATAPTVVTYSCPTADSRLIGGVTAGLSMRPSSHSHGQFVAAEWRRGQSASWCRGPAGRRPLGRARPRPASGRDGTTWSAVEPRCSPRKPPAPRVRITSMSTRSRGLEQPPAAGPCSTWQVGATSLEPQLGDVLPSAGRARPSRSRSAAARSRRSPSRAVAPSRATSSGRRAAASRACRPAWPPIAPPRPRAGDPSWPTRIPPVISSVVAALIMCALPSACRGHQDRDVPHQRRRPTQLVRHHDRPGDRLGGRQRRRGVQGRGSAGRHVGRRRP